MASIETIQQLQQHPEWIAPRSDVRVFLGEPGAPEATKTTVEPGNVFSPGMNTFGVTWWLRFPADGSFFATESAPFDTLRWRYEDGYLPLLHCETEVSGLTIRHSLFQDGTATDQSEAVCARLTIANPGSNTAVCQLFIALRSLGPAGGPVRDLKLGADGRSLWLDKRDLPLLGFDCLPDAFGCGVGDPSPLAQAGNAPSGTHAQDAEGWCFGLARFDLTLAAGASWQVALDCPQQTYGNLQTDFPGTTVLHPEAFESRAQAHLDDWRKRFDGISLDVPNADFKNAFFAGVQHMLTAMVGDQARIAALSYPLPWLRDSVYIIRAFDLFGLHDIARAATEYCARNDFFGGFGAEGDAPGQGIWALVQHYRLTHDADWLASVYPDIQRKCEWLFTMRRAKAPIQLVVDTPVLAFTHAERAAGVICMAAHDGIIIGTMDHGVEYALGWVNHWALCGLREAAFAAETLGYTGDAASYRDECAALQVALRAYAANHPGFWEHERTTNSILWPCRAWEDELETVEAPFNAWWTKYRGTDDAEYQPEKYWLYFEMAQAHNALLLGQHERAWRVIDYRLRQQDLHGLYGWREGGEGVGTENAIHGVTLINQLRGCQKFESITPHGWSQSEMWLLQRATLIEEWQDGLLLFAGIPETWLYPEAHIAFSGLPTWYGRVNAALRVDSQGQTAQFTLRGATPGTLLRLRLPGVAKAFTMPAGELVAQIELTRRMKD